MSNNASPPLVSVIMNCFDCEKYVREAIDSVYAQTYSHWEIIFWDNASTDGSADIARSYDRRLRYFRSEETIPLGAARNQALEQARGDFIAFLDSDDLWLPEKLEKQLPLFNDSRVGLVFSDAIYFNDQGDNERLYSRKRFRTGGCFSSLLTDYFLCISSVIIRRLVLEEQKEWFDPRFNLIEEADLFTRIAYSWNLAMVNEPLTKFRIHSASWTSTRGHLFAEEIAAMLAKYQELLPDFASRFPKEIRAVKAIIAICRAKQSWISGDSRLARGALAPYLFSSSKAFILYLLTFFPQGVVNFLINRFRIIRVRPIDWAAG